MNSVHEFIYYNKNYNGNGAFYGDGKIDKNIRREFLEKYSDYLTDVYNLSDGSKKAVDESEILSQLSKINYKINPVVRKQIVFDNMNACLKSHESGFEGWHFYTDKVKREGNTIVFYDGKLPPVPCAEYEFTDSEKILRLKFSVYIDSSFKYRFKSKTKFPLDTSTGRIIEIMGKKTEILKIQFYSDGTIYSRVGQPDRYHTKFIKIGNFEFDKWIDIKISFYPDNYSVLVGNNQVDNISYTDNVKPECIFFSGGRYVTGNWKVKLMLVEYENHVQNEFFILSNKATNEYYVGKVSLPFCLGGYENRNKHIILTNKFHAEKGKRYVVELSTLNPGGKVFINNICVLKTDDFLAHNIEISDYIKDGLNDIKIIVNPRAPEAHYSWHQNRDRYNAWYCGKAIINILPENNIDNVKINTLSVQDGVNAEITVKFYKKYSGRINIYISKTNPEKSAEKLLWTDIADGVEYSLKIQMPVKLWSVEEPYLYSIRAEMTSTIQDDFIIETGFRTIEQKNGEILFNNKKICLKGALVMQFLHPYDNICLSHLCPTDKEIVEQICQLKNMNANVARLHILGYGTNDSRFAEYCDRLGIMLIWTTALIDSVESIQWTGVWNQGAAYQGQMEEVISHPCIIMWEGSNEWRADNEGLDSLYDQFVKTIREKDTSRLICPCSHCYYGGGLYGDDGFYFQDDGLKDHNFNDVKSSWGWKDNLVVRSAHTYEIMLGYGCDWNTFLLKQWNSEHQLLTSKKHAYIVSEIAVMGRQDYTTKENANYSKNNSYELLDEKKTLGMKLKKSEWKISQAYQSLSALHIIKSLLSRNADGIMWCCLSGGANDGSYLKPLIDFYGYAKYGFYTVRDMFADTICFNNSNSVVFGKNFILKPLLTETHFGCVYNVKVLVKDTDYNIICKKDYKNIEGTGYAVPLKNWKPSVNKNGYYCIEYKVEKWERREGDEI